MFEHDFYKSNLLLFVLVYDDDRLFVVWNLLCYNLLCVRIERNVAEHFLDFLFCTVNVNVAYNDDSLIVWAIPLVVVVAENLWSKVVYDFHFTDRHTLAILRTRIEVFEVALKHTHHW